MNTKYEKIAGAISEDQLDDLIAKEHISGATTPVCIVGAVIGATGAIIAATLGSGNCPTAKCGQGGGGGHRHGGHHCRHHGGHRK